MASVHRDPRYPKGVWYCSFTLAGGQRTSRSTGTKNKSQAKAVCEALEQAERAAASGHLSTSRGAQLINETLVRAGQRPIEVYRLGDWFTEWLATKTSISQGLLSRYRFAYDQLLRFLGPGSGRRFLDSVTESEANGFLAHLKSQGRCASTLNRIRADLSVAFNRALKSGKISHNPFSATEREKSEPLIKERKTFTPDQVSSLIENAPHSDWEGLIRLGYTTGMRLSDGANLRWDGLELAEGIIVFRQRKTGRQTTIAIHPDFRAWLERSSALDISQEFVFPTLAGLPAGGNCGLSAQFNEIVRAAGIDAGQVLQKRGSHGRSRANLTFHSFRHGAASAIFNSAVLREIAGRVTGHAQGERGSLERYLHVDPAALKAASSLIPRLPPLKRTR